jgi:hypothetical protein
MTNKARMEKMQETVNSNIIEIDKKIVGSTDLPKTLVLYTVDATHFVLSVKPLDSLEKTALTATHASVTAEQSKYLIKIPAKIYNFYKMVESDYTIMASKKDPLTIIISI